MTNDFKRKLKQYTEGTLPEAERAEVEAELEKLEAYQQALEELVGEEGPPDRPQTARSVEEDGLREKAILRKGKWKARLSSALTALGIVVVATFFSGLCTSLFYTVGEPNRMQMYQDVVGSALAVTRPNMEVNLSGQGNAFFTADLSGQLRKKIGDRHETVGQYSLGLLLSRPGLEQISWTTDIQMPYFHRPGSAGQDSSQAWAQLEKLPEGTVAEAYVSLNRLFGTGELLKQLENKPMSPVWFAVDTGLQDERDVEIVYHPVGFPAYPIWHHQDMQVVSRTEEKWGWFGKITGQAAVSPNVEAYGDEELRNRNFKDTLAIMQEYPALTQKVAPWLELDRVIPYVEANGVQLLGVVVTGPTKEILKLREEPWVAGIGVGEVRLWNWLN